MAISYPRSLADLSFAVAMECDLQLVTGTAGGRTRGGGTLSVEIAAPYWDFRMETRPLTRSEKAQLQAWWNTLRGGGKTFYAWDRFNSYPQAYASQSAVLALTRAGGGSFDGTFEITSVPDAYSLRTNGGAAFLPANFVLTAGDYISCIKSGVRSLHRVTQDVTATIGGVMNASERQIAIEPAINTTIFTASFTANIVKPLGEFVPDDSRFEARQTTLPSGATIAGFSKVQA